MINTRSVQTNASEIKFVVEAQLAERIRTWARSQLEPDPHGGGSFGDEYTTTTIYFDNAARDVFYQRGSYGRAKYRIRRYEQSDFVVLERKLRRPGTLIKRRTQVSVDALARLDCLESDEHWPGEWFQRRVFMRGLEPVCQLTYRRTARMITTHDGTVRLTLDASIQGAAVSQVQFTAHPGTDVLLDRLILEMKFRGPLPTVFKRLIEEFCLNPLSVSKYRLGMGTLEGLTPGGALLPPVAIERRARA